MTKQSIKVSVTTAVALSQKQIEMITKAVEKKHDGKVEIKEVVNPDVIGGVKVSIGSTEFDATIKTKLQKIHAQLSHNI